MRKQTFSNTLIYDYLFGILLLVLPFGNGIANIFIILLTLLFLLKFDKKVFLTWYNSPFIFLALLVLYLIIQAIYNGSFLQDSGYYSRYGYLVLVPLLLLKVRNKQLVKFAAILSVNTTIVLSIIKVLIFYSKFKFLPFADGWATNAVLVLERPYTGIFCLISIILSFEQISLNTKFKGLFITSLMLSTFFIFFISIRISILSFLAISILYGIFYLKTSVKNKIITLISLVTLFLIVIGLNPNIAKRFFIQSDIENTVVKFKESEPRMIIWNCAYQVTQQEDFSILLGTNSYSNIKNSMVACYEKSIEDYSRREWFLSRKYNTHNQYLDFYLIGGVLALLLLFIFLASFLIKNKDNFYAVAIVFCFFIMMSVENIFHRQFGCLIFTIFVTLALNSKKENVKN